MSWGKEKTLTDFLPFSSPVSDSVVISRSGDLMSTIKLSGIAFETVDDDLLDQRGEQLNTYYRSLASAGFALVVHRIRRQMTDRLSTSGDSTFVRDFAERYYAHLEREKFMSTEIYVTVIARDLTSIKVHRSEAEIRTQLDERIEAFTQKVSGLLSGLAKYSPVLLGTYHVKGVAFSSQLEFYNFLVSGVMQPVRVPTFPLYEALGGVEVFAGSDMLELQSATGSMFCQSIELKDYAQETFSGILDDLLYPQLSAKGAPHYPFIETQTFALLSKNEGLKALQLQQRQLLSSKDAAVSQIVAMNAALDGVTNGDFVMGEYSYTLTILGTSQEEVRNNTLNAAKKLSDAGFVPLVSTRALMGSYLSQLPGNFSYRPRTAKITSLNFSHLAALHNFPCGKRNGNPWGEAVTLMLTPSGQPYYFNFHSTSATEDAFGKMALANTTIIGQSGSGKTALVNFLLTMAQKYRDDQHKLTTVYFDKDRGAEIALRAMGGGYLTIENAMPTGFNPFQLEATPENLDFLTRLLKVILSMDGLPIHPADEAKLVLGIRTVMGLPKEARRMALLLQTMTEGATREEIATSLPKRLAKWVGRGPLAWVFDNPVDTLDFDAWPNFGIDGTDFLDNREVRAPIAFYLLYRLESILDGRRMFFTMDEFWKWLLDDAFEDFAKNKLKTIRKQNGFGVFATQSPSDVLTSPIAKAVIEQSATQIFLPNPKATAEDYVEGFKLTPTEFQIIKSLAEDSRMMLIKQGTGSVVCRLDLSPFKGALRIFSGSTESSALLDSYRRVLGNDPDVWLPYFLGVKRLDI